MFLQYKVLTTKAHFFRKFAFLFTSLLLFNESKLLHLKNITSLNSNTGEFGNITLTIFISILKSHAMGMKNTGTPLGINY